MPTTSLLTYEACPVCASKEIHLVLTPKDHTVSQESFEIWHCDTCQFRFTQHVPDEANIGPYYQSEEYISHSNTSKGLVNRLYQVVRNITLGQKRRLVTKLSQRSSGNILDIGCGTGDFLGTMKQAGWKTLGLEPDQGARELGKQNHGLEVLESEQLFELAAGEYDVISMWHVLEHVHRLHEYLSQIQQLLQPDGAFLIAVPNYPAKDASRYQEYWAAYDVPRHLYHFSAPAMERLLSQHGFRVEEIRRMPFDAFYVSLLSEKYQSGRLRLISAFWQGLRSYVHSLSHPEAGSSLLYVIRKA